MKAREGEKQKVNQNQKKGQRDQLNIGVRKIILSEKWSLYESHPTYYY